MGSVIAAAVRRSAHARRGAGEQFALAGGHGYAGIPGVGIVDFEIDMVELMIHPC